MIGVLSCMTAEETGHTYQRSSLDSAPGLAPAFMLTCARCCCCCLNQAWNTCTVGAISIATLKQATCSWAVIVWQNLLTSVCTVHTSFPGSNLVAIILPNIPPPNGACSNCRFHLHANVNFTFLYPSSRFPLLFPLFPSSPLPPFPSSPFVP